MHPGQLICGFFIEYWPLYFALGSCLYFSLCVFTDQRSRWIFIGAVVALGLASAARLFPWTANTTTDLRAMAELAFLSAVTLGLFLLRPLSARISRMAVWRPIAALGAISYSLYLIHQFNLTLVASIAERLLPTWAPHFVTVTMMVGLHLALAPTLFWYFCERPFLSKEARPSCDHGGGRRCRANCLTTGTSTKPWLSALRAELNRPPAPMPTCRARRRAAAFRRTVCAWRRPSRSGRNQAARSADGCDRKYPQSPTAGLLLLLDPCLWNT